MHMLLSILHCILRLYDGILGGFLLPSWARCIIMGSTINLGTGLCKLLYDFNSKEAFEQRVEKLWLNGRFLKF